MHEPARRQGCVRKERDECFDRTILTAMRKGDPMNVRAVIIVLCLVLAGSPVLGDEKTELKTDRDKSSYAIGLDMGNSLKKNSIDVNVDLLVKGMKDSLSGAK